MALDEALLATLSGDESKGIGQKKEKGVTLPPQSVPGHERAQCQGVAVRRRDRVGGAVGAGKPGVTQPVEGGGLDLPREVFAREDGRHLRD